MSNSNRSVRELQIERASLWAQLDVETHAHTLCPGLDLDEYRELRRSLYQRLDEIEYALTAARSASETSRTRRGILGRALAFVHPQ